MIETVEVTPLFGNDSDGNPKPPGAPVTLTVLEIAPGNGVIKYGQGGDLLDVEFTVYLPLRDEHKVKDGDEILVRGRKCVATVQVWRSQRSPNQGGVVVLARMRSGKAA